MTAIARASRNALILRWLRSCDARFLYWVRCLYGAQTSMPQCELGDDETFTQDAEVLEWLGERFKAALALFEEDQL